MTPEDLVRLAINVAEDGMSAGEPPIGAVVAMGAEIVGRAYAQERSQEIRPGRRPGLAVAAGIASGCAGTRPR
jgi:hypothetical protein